MIRNAKKPAVKTNYPVRYIQLQGLGDKHRVAIDEQWGAMIKEGAYFKLLLSGQGMFDCLVDEAKADDFLEAIGFPKHRSDAIRT